VKQRRKWHDRFIRAFARTGNVTTSAAAAGVSREAAYHAREIEPGDTHENDPPALRASFAKHPMWVTPYDDAVLVMPGTRNLKPGGTAVRIGRFASD